MKSVEYVGTLGEMEYDDTERRFERGYYSRRVEINKETEVYSSGDGRLFYYAPCFFSTVYKYRMYLIKDGKFIRAW